MPEEFSAADANATSDYDLITLADLFPTLGHAAPLDYLVSDSATRTWFNSAGFTTWSDISCMALDEIKGWPGLGRQRVEQLMNDLARAALASRPEPLAEDATLEPDIASSSMTLGELFPSISPATLVENLVRDTRARNAIGRRCLTTWAQLAPLKVEVIRGWNGIGARSIQSLLQDLAAYEPGRAAVYERANANSSPLSVRFPDLEPSIPLRQLTHDTRLFNALEEHEVSDWQQLSRMSVAQIAAWPGIGPTSIEKLLVDLARAPFPEAPVQNNAVAPGPGPSTREQLMIQMREEGATLDAIGEEFGVTRERVRQILAKNGGPTPAEVRAKQAQRAQEQAEAQREQVDQAVRPVLLANGAMSVQELSEATGVTDTELTEFWPEDLEHLRIWTAGRADQTWSDEAIFSAIREAALFEFPLTAKAYTELVRVGQVHGPSLPRVHQRFGGWAAACDAAGVEHGQTMRASYNTRWTDEELLAYAREYFLAPDWPSSAHRFDVWKQQHTTEGPSQQTLRNRFGSWSNVKRLALRPGDQAHE